MGEVHSKNDFFEISMKYNYFSVRKGKIEFRKDQKQILIMSCKYRKLIKKL